MFGKETLAGDGVKVQAEWDLVFQDGTVATIYDYKEDIPKEQVTNWHIGGYNNRAVELVTDVISNADDGETTWPI